LNRCESVVKGTDQQWQNKLYYQRGSITVKSFFDKHEMHFSPLFGDIQTEMKLGELEIIKEKMKSSFIQVFQKDYHELLLQEVLDNESNLGLYKSLSLVDQFKHGPRSLYNLSNVMKDMVFNANNRFISEFGTTNKDMPQYFRPMNKIYASDVQYWFDLMPEERQDILGHVYNGSSNAKLEDAERITKKRCNKHWLNLINLISAPILYWQEEDNEYFPQVNLLNEEDANRLKELYRLKKEEREKEKILLDKHIAALKELKYLDEIETYLSRYKPAFSHHEFHERWIHELTRMEARLKQRQIYYDTRMKEFGFYETMLSNEIKRMWLEELLKIEDEVKPFISYVKKAFQSALPIRKRVSFSELRHVNDGVEFDADTLFDHEKWIRADVMKAMESKIEKGEAIQINTFCLDYSGSMNQSRMRNLFKVLYLLVLGLEDRKSYDAFHFFSNNFIEVVNFSDEFTNRKVLFRIMRQITSIVTGSLIYSGEGGTHMSEGIAKSHEKMKKFTDGILTQNPQANILSSIFVITDGEPSIGITDSDTLNEFIETKRQDGDVEIKGIFIRSEDDFGEGLLEDIFGENHFIETTDFKDGVNKFVKIMTETYKEQRRTYKWKLKKRKLGLTE